MGDILVKMYDIVTNKAGFDGRLKFAEKIGIPKTKAAEVEDTSELVAKGKKAASEILGQDIDTLL
jgi:hypothetical protein